MLLMNDNFGGFNSISDNDNYRHWVYWTYNIPEKDFMMSRSKNWQNLMSEGYRVSIGNNVISMPYNYHILIADEDGSVDIISPAEILGRHYTALTLDTIFDKNSFRLKPIEVVGYFDVENFIWPKLTSDFLTVKISRDRVILVADRNIYNRVKKMNVNDFLI